MKLVPDLATLRLIPWLPKTALVFCDVYTEDGEPIEEAPRWVLRGRWSARPPWATPSRRRRSWSSTASRSRSTRRAPSAITGSRPSPTTWRTITSSRPPGRSRSSAPSATAWRTPTCRWRCSKGEWGKGQEEINLRYAEALEMADRAALFKHGVKEIADQHGRAVTFMAKYDVGAAGSSFHLHSSLWDRAGATPLFADGGRSSPLFGAWLGGQIADGPRAGALLRAVGQRLQALPGGLVRAHAHRGRASTIAPAASGSAARAPSFRVENRIPGADANPYLAFAATIAAGLHGVRSKLQGAQALRRQRLRGRHPAAGAEDPARGDRRARGLPDRGRGLRRARRRALPARRAPRASRPSTPR